MKWERFDFAVGALVTATVAVTLGAMLWLSPIMDERTYPLVAELDNIQGIAVQAPVFLNGFEIGRVAAIEPRVREDGKFAFQVHLSVRERLSTGEPLPLPVGTQAMVVTPPFLGSGHLQLVLPEGGGPPLSPGARIPGSRGTSFLESTQQSTDRLTADLLGTLQRTQALLDSLETLSGSTARAVARTEERLPGILTAVEEQLAATALLTDAAGRGVLEITPAVVASLDSLRALLSASRQTVQRIDGMLLEQEPRVEAASANLDTTTVLLKHFVREVSERPLRVLTGIKPPAPEPRTEPPDSL